MPLSRHVKRRCARPRAARLGFCVVLCATSVLAGAPRVRADEAGSPRGEQTTGLPTPAALVPAIPRIGLAEALTRATQKNPRAEVALEEIRRAEALVTEARAGFLPSLAANGLYTRLDHDRQLSGRVLANQDQVTANLTLSVPLLAPQRWVQTRQAKDRAEVSRLDADEVRRQVAISTAHAYLAVVAQHRVIEVDQRALDNARAHFDYAHTRNLGGIGNQLDDTRAGQDVASREAALEQALAGLTQAQEALGVMVGVDGALDSEDQVHTATPAEVDAREVPQRGDVLAGRRRVRAAEHVERDTWADYAPTLGATFAPFYNHPSTPTQPRTGWSAQLILSIPLFQGGLRIGQQRERDALLAESRAQLAGVEREAKSQVRVSLSTVQRAEASFAASSRAAELARQALEMATLAYKAGATTNIEIIDAERRARDAEADAVAAEDAARRARLDLLAALGKLTP